MNTIDHPIILNEEEVEFLNENLNIKPETLFFKKSKDKFSYKKIAIQLEARNRVKKKLPTWTKLTHICFPIKLSLEQCSSEKTALYKTTITPKGKSFIDITGGLGIDTSTLATNFIDSTYVELNENLTELAKHNFKILNKNINVIHGNGIHYVINNSKQYDLIFMDPARRKAGEKVFHLSDCTPNIVEHQIELLNKTKILFSKHSPLLDLTHLVKTLIGIRHIYIVSISNDCKEILVHQESDYKGEINMHTINFTSNGGTQKFNSLIENMNASISITEKDPVQEHYIYIPNTSILKSSLSETLAVGYSLKKYSNNTHFYTSDKFIENYPGRCFQINYHTLQVKELKKRVKKQKRELICRNAQIKPEELAKKLSVIKGSNSQFILAGKNNLQKTTYFDCTRIF